MKLKVCVNRALNYIRGELIIESLNVLFVFACLSV